MRNEINLRAVAVQLLCTKHERAMWITAPEVDDPVRLIDLAENNHTGALMSASNEGLAAVIAAAGCSHAALARDVRDLAAQRGLISVRCNHVDVGRWLDGMIPRGDKPALIAEALGRRLGRPIKLTEIGMASRHDPPTLLALEFLDSRAATLHTARTLWIEDVKRSEFVQHGIVTGAMLVTPMARWLLAPDGKTDALPSRGIRVGTSDVDAVRATLHMFEKLDHRFGGGHARTAAVQYLVDSVSPLLNGRFTEETGRDLFAVAAHFTYKTGAMAYDSGLHGLARRYFIQALNLAHVSGDRSLGGKVLALMSHQANFLGEYQEAVDLARAAKLGAAGHATRTTHAMYCVMEARALANQNERSACARAIREAESSFDDRNENDDPDWIRYFDEAEFHDELGHCFTSLRAPSDAAFHANIALASESSAYPRSRIFCRFSLAMAQLESSVEEACDTAHRALIRATSIKSARIRTYVRTFNQRLTAIGPSRASREFRQKAEMMLNEQT